MESSNKKYVNFGQNATNITRSSIALSKQSKKSRQSKTILRKDAPIFSGGKILNEDEVQENRKVFN